MGRRSTKKSTGDTVATEEAAPPPRRSGRAASKPEPPPPQVITEKKASRGKRGSTAAQTAVAKETQSPRAKSARRESSKVYYTESDGEEEEAPPAKPDKDFESDEDFQESDSETEKTKKKPRGRSKAARSSSGKGRKGKAASKSKKSSSSKGRKGKQKKKAIEDDEEEDSEGFELSDDSAGEVKAKPTPSARSRKSKVEDEEEDADDVPVKSTRRSGRKSSAKDDVVVEVKKRPSRSVKAKKYAEEEEEEADELIGMKDEVESEETEGSRKRKRSSEESSNKRLKESDEVVDEEPKVEKTKEEVKEEEDSKDESDNAMEIDETDAPSPKEEKEEEEEAQVEEVKATAEKSETKAVASEKEEKMDDEVKSEEEDDQSAKEVVEKEEGKLPEGAKTAPVKEKESISQESNEASNSVPEEEVPTAEEKVPEAESPVEAAQGTNLSVSDDKPKLAESHPEPASQEKPAVETKPTESIVNVAESSVAEAAAIPSSNKPEVSVPTSVIQPINSLESNKASVETQVQPASSTPNGEHAEAVVPRDSSKKVCRIPGRMYAYNKKLSDNVQGASFGVASYNLASFGCVTSPSKEELLDELASLDAQILCIQQCPKPFYNITLEPFFTKIGYQGLFAQPSESLKGMATFYKSDGFRVLAETTVQMKRLIDEAIDNSSMDMNEKSAVRNHIKRSGSVFLSSFGRSSNANEIAFTVVNVQIPITDASVMALQMGCLGQLLSRKSQEMNKPFIICGEFNIAENDASYSLFRDGYLSNEMTEGLQKQKNVILPGRGNHSLIDLLCKSFKHSYSNLCSAHKSLLGKEFTITQLGPVSQDMLWLSPVNMHLEAVLDADPQQLQAVLDRHRGHFYLKADVALAL